MNRLVPDGGATVFAKCEFFQPLNSVKDRIGVAMIEAGERDGKINADTHVIEPTSGNTGIALAFVCAAKGYKLTLTMPESMSVETFVHCSCDGCQSGSHAGRRWHERCHRHRAESGRQDRELVHAHSSSTTRLTPPFTKQRPVRRSGPTAAKRSTQSSPVLVPAETITGVSRFLKQQNPDFKAFAVEPKHSPVISGGSPGKHRIQGIGAGFIPGNLDTSIIDDVVQIDDEDAFGVGPQPRQGRRNRWWNQQRCQHLCGRAGGRSSRDEGKRIVTIMCSLGERYLSTPSLAIWGCKQVQRAGR